MIRIPPGFSARSALRFRSVYPFLASGRADLVLANAGGSRTITSKESAWDSFQVVENIPCDKR